MALAEADLSGSSTQGPPESSGKMGSPEAALALKPRERSSPRAAAAEEATQSAKAPVSDGKRRPEATLIGPGMESVRGGSSGERVGSCFAAVGAAAKI